MGKRVLITGITGFLGSQIAEILLNNGFQLIAIKREGSDLWRCENFISDVKWVNIVDDWEEIIIHFSPQIIVHSAWEGVTALERDDFEKQFNNLSFILKLLQIAKVSNTEKFIAFGSQAEYGHFSGIISEDYDPKPVTAYGLSKKFVSQTINLFCEQNNIDWFWLRLFSFFGEKEASNWFIPTLINNIIDNKSMDMTLGEQRYAYMYVKDLAENIYKIIDSQIMSGVYNLSSNKSISLKEIVEKITDILKVSKPQINFGALPYRENQPMLIQGSVKKLENQIGPLTETDFDFNLEKVVDYIVNKTN